MQNAAPDGRLSWRGRSCMHARRIQPSLLHNFLPRLPPTLSFVFPRTLGYGDDQQIAAAAKNASIIRTLESAAASQPIALVTPRHVTAGEEFPYVSLMKY